MDFNASRSGSPTPLQQMSPERANQQPNIIVADKAGQFNSIVMQSKHLERKTADAALKRAMLGREEAETEMRRYREEVRQLKKQVEEGRDRERRVGERLETVMENYGRAKETHAHTQALWEKEIRRARKETFKCQSAIVKLQEELKTARTGTRTAEEALAHEKERSKAREQEAFQARYELVGCHEELEQALQRIKALEQERDAFRSLAKSEEDIARIASEGRLPLPPPESDEEEETADATEEAEAQGQEGADADADKSSGQDSTDEDGSIELLAVPKPRMRSRKSLRSRISSAALLDVKSSAASEAEIDELTRLWQWEKQRADRSSELVEYLEAECFLRACSCMKKRPRQSMIGSPRKRQALDIGDGGDRMILSDKAAVLSPTAKIRANFLPDAKNHSRGSLSASTHSADGSGNTIDDIISHCSDHAHSPKQERPDGARRSTIFIPEEGVFRTVSQQIAEEMEEAEATMTVPFTAAVPEPEMIPSLAPSETLVPQALDPANDMVDDAAQDDGTTIGDVTADTAYTVEETEQSIFARTPSVDPPAFAQPRTSLLSLLDAPHRQEVEQPINFYVPTTPGPAVSVARESNVCMDITMDDVGDVSHVAPRAAASILVSSTSACDIEAGMIVLPEFESSASNSNYETAEEGLSRASDVSESFARSRWRQNPPPPVAGDVYTPEVEDRDSTPVAQMQPHSRPHTATGTYSITTTTKVPLRAETTDPSLAQRIMAAQRTPTHKTLSSSMSSDGSDTPSFDINNPAMTPTMSREQCLAQIRERRGRARSAAGGSSSSTSSGASGAAAPAPAHAQPAGTQRRPVTPGKERREVSAPVRRVASVRRG